VVDHLFDEVAVNMVACLELLAHDLVVLVLQALILLQHQVEVTLERGV
jgi:hypothetical protein